MDTVVVRRSGVTASRLRDHLGDADVPVVLTLVVVLLASSKAWYVATPVALLAVAAIVFPAAARTSSFWFLVAGALASGVHEVWYQADNHQFLIAYWTVAIGLSYLGPHPGRDRARSARLLLVAVFLLAALWKGTSAEFVDGSFFEFTLLSDSRFAPVASVLGGVDATDLDANQRRLATLGGPSAEGFPLAGHSPRLARVADALAWWTLAVEALLAVAFLRRAPRWLASRRDHLLIAFVVTTYAAAPVVGFGWILVCLGLAQREPGARWVPLGYAAAFVVVRLGATPLPMALARLLPQ
jgi:hypothetical protein